MSERDTTGREPEPSLRARGVLLWTARACGELLVLAFGPCLLLLADYYAFGAGERRFLALAALFAFVALVTARRLQLRSVLEERAGRALLAALVLGCLWVAGRTFAHDIARPQPCWTDMGRPSVCAGELLLAGMNPWAECIPRKYEPAQKPSRSFRFCRKGGACVDYKSGGAYGKRWRHHGPGFDFMDGYKYGPLMALSYLPATHLAQEAGLAWVNLAFFLAQLAAVLALARAAFPGAPASGLRALLVLLLPAVLPSHRVLERAELEAFGRTYVLEEPLRAPFVRALTFLCSNDVLPMTFALLGCLYALRGRSLLAGVQIGLSLATKQLPAALLALLLVRARGVDGKRFALGAVATATLLYLPFFLWGPKEMIANLVLFGLARPTNSSSLRAFLPRDLQWLVSLAQLGLAALLVVRFARAERRDAHALLRSATLLVIGFVALNKIVHGNYLLWIQPLLALAVAGAWRGGAGRDATAPRSDTPATSSSGTAPLARPRRTT